MDSFTDIEPKLFEQFRSGSEAAFTQLYKHYSVRLYYNILSMVKDELTAEEMVQDIFFTIWRNRSSIKIQKSFGDYLFVCSRNKVYDFFKKLKRDHILYEKIVSASTSSYTHIEEAILARENNNLLQKAIASLPPQRRRAFELCKLEGLTYSQASQQMGVSLSTLKDHMKYAHDAVRLYINQHREVAVSLFIFVVLNRF